MLSRKLWWIGLDRALAVIMVREASVRPCVLLGIAFDLFGEPLIHEPGVMFKCRGISAGLIFDEDRPFDVPNESALIPVNAGLQREGDLVLDGVSERATVVGASGTPRNGIFSAPLPPYWSTHTATP